MVPLPLVCNLATFLTGFQTAELPLCYLTHLHSIVYNPSSTFTVSMTTPVLYGYTFLFTVSGDFFFLFTERFKLLFLCL